MRTISTVAFAAVVLSALLALLLAAASPVRAQQLTFFSLGDWGSVNKDQADVATQLATFADKYQPSFFLITGDNFYEDGVANDTDPQWQTTYEQVYSAPSLQVPWYAVLGNHDHHLGRGQGEIDFYLNKRDSRWVMPAYWFNQTFTIPGTSTTVQVLFIDTILLTGITSSKKGPLSPLLKDPASEQYAWINATLEKTNTDWIFIVGHYPVYSGGEHGNTAPLVDDFLPILQKYNVDLYLCGHDHTLQHLQDSAKSTQYFISGNGAKRGTYTAIPQSLFGAVDPGFMVHQLTPTTLTTSLVDHEGKTIYTYTQNILPKSSSRKDIAAL